VDLEQLYFRACTTPGNIHEHLPTLRRLSSGSRQVIEFGVEHAISTTAMLAGQPGKLTSYDLRPSPETESLRAVAGRTEFDFRTGDSLTIDPEPCDLLFIDSLHTEAQLRVELNRHAADVGRWIVLHDIISFGWVGEHGQPGLMQAVIGFLRHNHVWQIAEVFTNNNGLLVLERRT